MSDLSGPQDDFKKCRVQCGFGEFSFRDPYLVSVEIKNFERSTKVTRPFKPFVTRYESKYV